MIDMWLSHSVCFVKSIVCIVTLVQYCAIFCFRSEGRRITQIYAVIALAVNSNG